METPHGSLQLLCLLIIIPEVTIACGGQQYDNDGVCCDMCPPGFFLEETCSQKDKTNCKPCAPGSFADKPNIFDRCENCRICDQGYSQNCTPTTDAKCSCSAGFLCSDGNCSKCEKDKCKAGERRTRTDRFVSPHVTKYVYECEPCKDHEYYLEKTNICVPRTSCQAYGLGELFAGNKTHDAICQSNEKQVSEFVTAGFALLIVAVGIAVVGVSYCSAKKIKKGKASQAVKVTSVEICPLSMEETIGPIEVEHKDDSYG